MALKFKIQTSLDWETGESKAVIELDDWIVFGPIDVTHLRGQYFEDNVRAVIVPQFAAALRAALLSLT
jgi:hypothetical protein